MKPWETRFLIVASYLVLMPIGATVASEETASLVEACGKALKSGDFTQAAAQAGRALQLSSNNRDAHLCFGRAKGALGSHDEAVLSLRAADSLSVTPMEHMVALTLLGNQLKSVKDYATAAETYRKSLAIARVEKNTNFERINLNQIGESLAKAGDAKGALEHYLMGAKLAANDNERADGNARIAAAYSILEQHDKAIEYQIKAVVMEERSGDLEQYVSANIELGRIYNVATQYGNAEKALDKILGIILQAGNPYWEAKARLTLGKAQQEQGKTHEAADQFAKAKALAEGIGDSQLAMEAAEAQSALSKPM